MNHNGNNQILFNFVSNGTGKSSDNLGERNF